MHTGSILLALGCAVSAVSATINNMRATLPGSLHQCEQTNIFFFDTDDTGSKTLLLIKPEDAASLGSGILQLDQVLSQITPLQTVSGITVPDASAFNFILRVASGQGFSSFGFLSDGQGRDLALDRQVQDPLPGAVNCLAAGSPTAISTTSSSTSTSRFTTSTRAASTSTTSSVAPTLTATTTFSAAGSSETMVVYADYLLTSTILLEDDAETSGNLVSKSIVGGLVSGNVSGTVTPFGNVLFQVNATTSSTTLISAAFSYTDDLSNLVFAVAETPLSSSDSDSEVLVLQFQTGYSDGEDSVYGNATILGKPQLVNSTAIKIDAYQVRTSN